MILSLFDLYFIDEYSGSEQNSLSIIDCLALIVSIFAIVFSVLTIKYTRKKEIEYDKFKSLVVTALDESFSIIYDDILKYKNNKKKLRNLSASLTNLRVFFIVIQKVYSDVNIEKLDEIVEVFSDKVFESTDEIERHFSEMKFSVLAMIYDFALKDQRFYDFILKKSK